MDGSYAGKFIKLRQVEYIGTVSLRMYTKCCGWISADGELEWGVEWGWWQGFVLFVK